ncbi:unnamed protein product, partial [Enterobius vermicularis]|uniref:BHLH domain-containing protein n=1 Tax=Enterobius vermicularis TaxID=51028 RepID=A0A0N4VMH8_ENTVE
MDLMTDGFVDDPFQVLEDLDSNDFPDFLNQNSELADPSLTLWSSEILNQCPDDSPTGQASSGHSQNNRSSSHCTQTKVANGAPDSITLTSPVMDVSDEGYVSKVEKRPLIEELESYKADQPQIVGKRKLTKSPLTDAVDNFAYDGISHKRRDYRQRLGSPDTLTIMPSPLNEPQSSSNENSITFNDSDMETDNSSARVSTAKSKRRTPHNLIEKKYRYSINDGIQRLKALVARPEEKLSKSGVLRAAIDYIDRLKQDNGDLQKEIIRLQNLLMDAGIIKAQEVVGCKTRAFRSHSPKFPCPSSASTSSEPSPSSDNGASHPMVDKARLAIVLFMFMFVVCNPLSVFIGKTPDNMKGGLIEDIIPGRALQEYTDDSSFDSESVWWHSSIVIWSVNIFVVVCFLTRLLVFGEPVADAESSSWAQFLKMKADAHACIRSWNYAEAERNFHECLKVLERPLPKAKYDELISVIWQIIRHLLNSIWIGRCFSRIRRSAAKTVPVVCRSHAQTAIIYHQLNQLHLTGPYNGGGKLAGLNFALCAVNLAESAGCSPDGLSHAMRADIYINAALQMKLELPPFIGAILSVYFMKRAKRHIQRAEDGVRIKLMWLFHPIARRFTSKKNFISDHLRSKSTVSLPYVRSCSAAKPIERLMSAFKLEMLKLLVGELNAPSGLEISYFYEVSQLLFSMCSSPKLSAGTLNVIDVTSFDSQGDEICAWWTNVFLCALYWRDLKYGSAAEHYAAVRKCPKILLAEPVSLAVGHALCTRKLCIHDRESVLFWRVICIHSSRSLLSLRKLTIPIQCSRTSNIMEAISDRVRLLSLEWLLISSFDLWRSKLDNRRPYWQQLPPLELRHNYEEILAKYRSVAKNNPVLIRK